MERQRKKRAAPSKQKTEKLLDPQDETDYDSEDTMIEFIKVECGTNNDGDPFINNIEIEDGQLYRDGEFEDMAVRKKAQTKQTLKDVDKRGRDHAATREKLAAKPTIPSTESKESLISLFSKTEQRLVGIEASLMEISGKLDTIGDQFQSILNTVDSTAQKKPMYIDIEFEKVDSLEQLETFNEELAKAEYEEKIRHWLELNIIDMRSDNRMSDAIDMLFTRRFLTCCSWTGIGKGAQKIAMMQMTNVTKLFQRIGTTSHAVVNNKRVAIFFMKKLKNATKRAMAKGVRRSTCRTMTSSSLEC
uniref:DUF4806 domain-containing protein n=1 Tax=Anopheles christyi TaxID=43041 RepID=A0A182K5V0_9DIPT